MLKSVTLRALLQDEFVGAVTDEEFRFCDSADCNTVYYSNGTSFTKTQLKVSVGVKETSGERPLCYCFGHSVTSIKDELRVKSHSDALEDIRRKMENPGCQCETENPSGACCLGSVAKGIETAQGELDKGDAAVVPTEDANKPLTYRGETIAKVGTVVSAIMASSCCWLPLVLLAVGVSGAGIASTLEIYRPLFMAVTFSFLAAAFYFTYRSKKSTVDGGHSCCATEEVEGGCPSATKGRQNRIALNKVMLWGVTFLALAFLLFPSYVGAILGGDNSKVTESMDRSVVIIEGMTCEGCSTIAAKAINCVPGVLAVEVSYDSGQAVVGMEAGCAFPQDAIFSAIENAGYTGSIPQTINGK